MLSLVALDFFQKSPLLAFPLIALGLFMLAFFSLRCEPYSQTTRAMTPSRGCRSTRRRTQ